MSATQVKICAWSTCNFRVNSDSGLCCILQDPDENKDIDLFNKTVEEKIEWQEAAPDAKEIDLDGVIFPADASFENRAFRKTIAFADARFIRDAHFLGAKFDGGVTFSGAEFGGGANFVGVEFDGDADFGGVEFDGDANFVGAEFHGKTDFFSVEFDGFADFGNAEFDGKADFSGVEFDGYAYLTSAEFDGEANFLGAEFSAGALFLNTEFRSEGSFHIAVVDDRVRFEDVDLSKVSFVRTDVVKVRFIGCSWPRKTESLLWPLHVSWPRFLVQTRNVVHDDLALDYPQKEGERVERDCRPVADLYRQLRLNLEATRQEVEAGDFYISQMEMRRQDPSYPWLYRFLLAGYRVLATYGQSYRRPFIWYALILAPLFALGYWRVGSVSYAEAWFSALTAGVLFQEVPRGHCFVGEDAVIFQHAL